MAKNDVLCTKCGMMHEAPACGDGMEDRLVNEIVVETIRLENLADTLADNLDLRGLEVMLAKLKAIT